MIHTPNFALTGDLRDIYCEYFREYWPYYNSTEVDQDADFEIDREPIFNIKMMSYQYNDYHYNYKMVSKLS